MAKGSNPIHIKPENKGKFHKAMGVPADKPISQAVIDKGKRSSSPAVRKEATFADNAKNKFGKK